MCVIRDRLGDRYYGRCVVMLGDPPTLPYRQVRSWGWGAKQYCDCFTRLRGHKLYCVACNNPALISRELALNKLGTSDNRGSCSVGWYCVTFNINKSDAECIKQKTRGPAVSQAASPLSKCNGVCLLWAFCFFLSWPIWPAPRFLMVSRSGCRCGHHQSGRPRRNYLPHVDYSAPDRSSVYLLSMKMSPPWAIDSTGCATTVAWPVTVSMMNRGESSTRIYSAERLIAVA